MKIISGLLTVLILIPAVAMVCHCCPMVVQDGKLGIEKTPCRSCCPGSSEIARDCGTLYEKQTFTVSQDSVIFSHALQTQTIYPLQREKNILVFQNSPPLSSLSLSAILRI